MARNKPAAHVRNPFYHSVPEEYDYARLLDGLRESREMARKLTRVSGASGFVNPDDHTVMAARQ